MAMRRRRRPARHHGDKVVARRMVRRGLPGAIDLRAHRGLRQRPERRAGHAGARQRRRHHRHPHALRHQRHHRQPVPHLVPDLREEALRGAHVEDPAVVVRRGLAREQHERLAAQGCQRQLRQRGERMVGGQAADERLGVHQRGLQRVRDPAGVDEGGVELVMQQRVDLFLRVQFGQRHMDAGVGRLELAQRLRQPAVQHRADKAHPQAADGARFDLARQHPRGLGLRQQRRGRFAKGAPGRGQPHPAAVAVEQPRADRGLELLDIERQRRLRDGQPARGAAVVQFLGQHEEVTQVAEFHGDTKIIWIKPILELDANPWGLNNGGQQGPQAGIPPYQETSHAQRRARHPPATPGRARCGRCPSGA
ncbi:hypothetical protein CBM2589_A90999 [Cupriavidus taiwanensis]|uniref:Uncharacterized protein n=1 Tax=Cupriavidus taiwanensis TaxID=164546 RepID=A0A976A9R5_9BURK|nr:hypothetical protein CBM2589_A90999 [Cupriavidus taiwanensis]